MNDLPTILRSTSGGACVRISLAGHRTSTPLASFILQAWQGPAGGAGRGLARSGLAVQVRRAEDWLGGVWRGQARQVRIQRGV